MMGTRAKKDRRKDKALRAKGLEPNGSPIAQSPLSDTALAQLVVLLNRMAVDFRNAYLEANPDTEWAVFGCHAFPTDVQCLTAVGFIGRWFEDRESGGSYLPLPWVVTVEGLAFDERIIKAIDPRLVEGFRADVLRAVATVEFTEALTRLAEDPLRYLTGNAPSTPNPAGSRRTIPPMSRCWSGTRSACPTGATSPSFPAPSTLMCRSAWADPDGRGRWLTRVTH